MAAAVEHVGSTAVPGLAAKPIIDIDVLLTSETMLPVAIQRLASLGYIYRGDLGIPQREAFFAPPAIRRITFTFAHHAVPSFEGTWRSEITSALTQRTPKPTPI